MKIASWNLARPRKGSDKINAILATLSEWDADILVLTETIIPLDLSKQYQSFHTTKPLASYYRADERQVSIYTRYDYYEEIATYRSDTAICVHLDTPLGPIAVYGTLIGTEDNTPGLSLPDLEKQIQDFEKISRETNLCICASLLNPLSEDTAFAEKRKRMLSQTFTKNHLQNLTAGIPENSSPILLSKSVENNYKVRTEKWNVSKTMSDHLGVGVSLVAFE